MLFQIWKPLTLPVVVSNSVIASSFDGVAASHHEHHQKCTQLWVYTEPVQKGPCVVFRSENSTGVKS